jgi:biopolymer transport protein ExbB/TolQ
MDVFALIKSFIYLISCCLLYPDLLLLAGLTVWMVFYGGRFCAEWLERHKLKKINPEHLRGKIDTGEFRMFFSHDVNKYIECLKSRLDKTNTTEDADVIYLMRKELASLHASLDLVKILIRIGPALGLIGTLIPMGTGLAGLGQGDISSLNSELVIAFTTTVVGLALGLFSYFLYMIKRRWIDEDARNVEYLTEILTK